MAWLTFHPNAAAVMFHNLLADGQTQPSASRFIFQCIAHLYKFLKHL